MNAETLSPMVLQCLARVVQLPTRSKIDCNMYIPCAIADPSSVKTQARLQRTFTYIRNINAVSGIGLLYSFLNNGYPFAEMTPKSIECSGAETSSELPQTNDIDSCLAPSCRCANSVDCA